MVATQKPTISIVTVVYNCVDTIGDAIESVAAQTYDDVEYVVVDGESTDGTVEKIRAYGDAVDRFVSEPDDGIFSAMNKGIGMTSGEVVGLLNADDFYADASVLERVAERFAEEDCDCVYGDLVYVDPDHTDEVVRYWKGGEYSRSRFRRGWMPPHPTFFVRRELYERYGGFRPELDVSADYELVLRFLYRHRASAAYIPETLVKMRAGGNSNESLGQRLRGHLQDYQSWLQNGEIPNPITLTMKPLSKLLQFVTKPDDSAPEIDFRDSGGTMDDAAE